MSFNLNRLVQPECGGSNPLVSAAQQIAMRPSAMATTSRLAGQQQAAPDFVQEYLHQHKQAMIQESSKSLKNDPLSAMSKLNLNAQTSTFNPMMQSLQPNLAQSSRIPLMGQQQMMLPSGSKFAADQLEAKYKKDVDAEKQQEEIRVTEKVKLGVEEEDGVEDVAFWKAIAGKYFGQTDEEAGQRFAEMAREGNKTQGDEDKISDLEFWQALSQKHSGMTTTTDTPFASSFESQSLMDVDKFKPLDLDYMFKEENPFKDKIADPFAEGLKKLEEGDIPSAVLLFEAAVQQKPQNSVAWRYLGTSQAQNENDREAIRALKNCLNLDANDQEARFALAVSQANETQQLNSAQNLLRWLLNQDKYKRIAASQEDFDQWLKGRPRESWTPEGLFEVEYVRNKFMEAARMSPETPDADVQKSLGVLFNMSGDYDKAADCFKAALSITPEDSITWNRLGATLANGNQAEEAVTAYQRALDLKPGFLRARNNLAISLITLNIYSEAGKQLMHILNAQAAGKGVLYKKSLTSNSIWSSLKTVATMMNKPELYPIIDERDLARCNEAFIGTKPTTDTQSGPK